MKIKLLTRLLAVVTALSCAMSVSAYDFKVDNIYYEIANSTNKTVHVAYAGVGAYSGVVNIPSTVTNSGTTYTVTGIAFAAFDRCANLASVSIPSTVTYIGSVAFQMCTGLTSIRIPNSVTTIDNYAFRECTALKSVQISNSLKVLKTGLFQNCTALTSVVIPDGVTEINQYVFKGCTALTQVTIGRSVTSMLEEVFPECENLQQVISYAVEPPVTNTWLTFHSTIYRTATLMVPTPAAVNAYKQADTWKHFVNIYPIQHYDFTVDNISYTITGENTVKVASVTGSGNEWVSTELSIPGTVTYEGVTYTVNEIEDFTFNGCGNVTHLVLPSTMTTLGEYAFSGCTNLQSVTCNSTVPPSMKNSGVFDPAVYSQAVLSVPRDSKSAYQAANYWKKFSTIEERYYDFMLDNMYYNITGDHTVTVTDRDMSHNSYSGHVSIPAGVVYENTPYDVTAIGQAAFANCTGLMSVEIPSTVTRLEPLAFFGCSALTSIDIPNSVSSIGNYAFNGCSALTHVALPYELSTINTYAFLDCSSLISVTIPPRVTYIGYGAFKGCTSLRSVTIPALVTTMSPLAFDGCTALESVTSLATTPPQMSSVTFDTSNHTVATLFVPRDAMSTYSSDSYWGEFANVRSTLDYALNVDGGTLEFSSQSQSDYPWTDCVQDGRTFAISGNKGARSSISEMTLKVNMPMESTLSFDFKAWGEGAGNNIWDKCVFTVDGEVKFTYGARANEWETYSVELPAGEHTLQWRYSKDNTVNAVGDYFAVDNVKIIPGNCLWMDDVEAAPGQTVSIPVHLSNNGLITGIQMGISLANMPQGTAVESVTVNEDYVHAGAQGYYVPSSSMIYFLNTTNNIIVENPGVGIVGYVNIKVPESATVGQTYSLAMSKVGLALSSSNYTYYLDDFTVRVTITAPATMRGDVNGDGNVSISDVTALIDLLLGGGEAPASADMNGDGNVSISDVTALIDYLLSGTRE